MLKVRLHRNRNTVLCGRLNCRGRFGFLAVSVIGSANLEFRLYGRWTQMVGSTWVQRSHPSGAGGSTVGVPIPAELRCPQCGWISVLRVTS